jgi:hypothetical protein
MHTNNFTLIEVAKLKTKVGRNEKSSLKKLSS